MHYCGTARSEPQFFSEDESVLQLNTYLVGQCLDMSVRPISVLFYYRIYYFNFFHFLF